MDPITTTTTRQSPRTGGLGTPAEKAAATEARPEAEASVARPADTATALGPQVASGLTLPGAATERTVDLFDETLAGGDAVAAVDDELTAAIKAVERLQAQGRVEGGTAPDEDDDEPDLPLQEEARPVQPYDMTFGVQGHVKDGQNPRLLDLLDRVADRAPELAGTPLAAAIAAGKVGPEHVEAVQRFLEEKGYPVGDTGVDGKYGPRTHAAVAKFLNGEPAGGATPLGLGDRGQRVQALQERLKAHGHDPGTIDGQLGPKTRAALMNFQRAQGLEAHGEADAATLEKLAAEPGTTLPETVPIPRPRPDMPAGEGPALEDGFSGPAVTRLQERLKELGFDPGPIDGDFGPRTESATRALQAQHGIGEDGKVGPETWKALGIVVKEAAYGPGGAEETTGPGGIVNTPDGPMVRRQGQLISTKIADQYDRMVAAAKADGVTLRINSAYRSYEEQVVLWNKYGQNPRRVARPGTSNHQKGTAIDFSNTGRAYQWLAQNAHRFGLYGKVPGEPWHYSLTGR